MRGVVLGLVAVLGLGLGAGVMPAVAAPNVMFACPTEARGAVSHNGDAGWVATTQSSRVLEARMDSVGGRAVLVCIYRMFGGDYWLYRDPPADYPNCRRSELMTGFYCGR